MCNVKRSVLVVVALTFLLGSASDAWAASITAYEEYMLGTTYVDAYANSDEDYNTWATDRITYPNLEDWSKAGSGTTLLWGRNTASSNPIDNTDLEGRDSDDLPQLTMTVTGLDVTKSYNVYAVYWAKNPEFVASGYEWYTLARLEGESELLEASYATATKGASDYGMKVIEVGRANRHGHPHPSTLDALRAVPFVGRTDRDGTVAVDVRAGEVTVRRLGAAGAG